MSELFSSQEDLFTESLPRTSENSFQGSQSSFLDSQVSTQTSDEEAVLITTGSIPSDLETANINGQCYVIYDQSKKDLFYLWWDQTIAKDLIADKKFRHPQWSNPHRTSSAWKQFHQVAESPSGTPKITCKICDTVLLHPTYTSHGTQGMNRHAASVQCKQTRKRKPNAENGIISAMVSISMTQRSSNKR